MSWWVQGVDKCWAEETWTKHLPVHISCPGRRGGGWGAHDRLELEVRGQGWHIQVGAVKTLPQPAILGRDWWAFPTLVQKMMMQRKGRARVNEELQPRTAEAGEDSKMVETQLEAAESSQPAAISHLQILPDQLKACK